jgi:hypothetical protein
MTAKKDVKRIIRTRMSRTGESYTAARRHFLRPKDSHMNKQTQNTDEATRALSIDQLALTLKTARVLKGQGVERIGELVDKAALGMDGLGLDLKAKTEVRDVLASRGL